MAYTYFKASLDYDPTLFASHVMLAWMTPPGEEDDKHVLKANELVKGKNENSQLNIAAESLHSEDLGPSGNLN